MKIFTQSLGSAAMRVACALAVAVVMTAGLLWAAPQGRTPSLSGSLSLAPAVVQLKGKSGQTATQILTIANRTSREFTFEMVAQDVIVRKGERVFVSAGELPGSIAATAMFSQKRLTVVPGGSASVTVTFTMPPSTSVRAAVAIFRGLALANAGEVQVTGSLGTLFTFTLSDNVVVEAEPLVVRAQTATSNMVVARTLINTGSEPATPSGVAAVLNDKGEMVGKTEFPQRRILPGQRLEMKADFPFELQPGRYKVLASLQVEGKVLTDSKEIVVP